MRRDYRLLWDRARKACERTEVLVLGAQQRVRFLALEDERRRRRIEWTVL